MTDPEPVTIVAFTMVVEPGGARDTLLSSGGVWHYEGRAWRGCRDGLNDFGQRVWQVELAPTVH